MVELDTLIIAHLGAIRKFRPDGSYPSGLGNAGLPSPTRGWIYGWNSATLSTWVRDIDRILTPPDDHPTTGEQVAQRLRTYLDDLLALPDLPPRLDTFRHHLNKVSTSYWPGLFHCYDIEGLPRTNNDLESHFRDTQRRLLRTTGQKGQTRRTLQRIGAWELLPRPPTEAHCLAALRQVPSDQLAAEQQRLRQHRERFRLHTRSIRRVNVQFDQLRQQWFTIAATSTG